MSKMERKTFEQPEEIRSINKGKIEIVKLGDVSVMRAQFEPGWSWSECVKPVVGTESCQVSHLLYIVSGRMGVRMNDGTEVEFSPGDVGMVPPGHDAWIIGNEKCVSVDFQGGATYAKH